MYAWSQLISKPIYHFVYKLNTLLAPRQNLSNNNNPIDFDNNLCQFKKYT